MSVVAFSLEHYELAGGPHRRRQIFEIGEVIKDVWQPNDFSFAAFYFRWFNTLDLTFINNH